MCVYTYNGIKEKGEKADLKIDRLKTAECREQNPKYFNGLGTPNFKI